MLNNIVNEQGLLSLFKQLLKIPFVKQMLVKVCEEMFQNKKAYLLRSTGTSIEFFEADVTTKEFEPELIGSLDELIAAMNDHKATQQIHSKIKSYGKEK
jgi:hypothetical protein